MRTRSISVDELEKLVAKDESHFFDFKSSRVDGKGVQKIAVAFANADGGEFILGISDGKEASGAEERWEGYENLEQMNSVLQAIFDVQPALTMSYEILTVDFSDRPSLRVEIEKSADVTYANDGKAYQRHGAQSLPLNPERIQQLAFAKGAASFEETPLPGVATERVVDSNALQIFVDQVVPSSGPLEIAVNLNLLDDRTWQPRVAGVLLFSEIPSALMPRKCSVKITRYETRENEPEREHLSFQRTIDGPL